MRQLQSKDVVRIIKSGKTGVVNYVDGNNVNIFVTQNNPYGLGIWYNIKEIKRIGRVKRIGELK